MKNLMKKLKPFVPENSKLERIDEDLEYQVIDADTEDFYGTVLLSDDGEFVEYEAFVDYDEEEMLEAQGFDTPVNIEEMKRLSQLFVDTFIDREVHFSMLAAITENSFMVTYEERDPKLGVMIPHTGCSLTFNRDGELTSATIGRSDFELEYPSIEITKEEAKERLRAVGYLELSIYLPGESEDGYGNAELIYRAKDDYTGVQIDGTIDSIYDFMEMEKPPVQHLTATKPTTTMEKMLDVHEGLVKKVDDGGSTIWVDPTQLLDEDEGEEPIISIFTNETGHFSYSNVPFEEQEDQEKLPVEELKDCAIQYLELVVGDVHEKYVLEDSFDEDELEELDELEEIDGLEDLDQLEGLEEIEEDFEDEWDEFQESEPTMMFSFYREHEGIRLESYDAHVHVGMYTGIIRECSVTSLTKEQQQSLSQLDTKPSLTMEEAEDRFFDEIEMKLTRAVKYFDDREIYTLTYLVDFPKTGGHIEKMNAHTGEVVYVDTGIIEESD